MKLVSNTLLKVLGILLLTALGVAGCTSGLIEPERTISSYEMLELETWVGKMLPILEHIDIAESLKKGNWMVLLYHYDCPECGTAIQEFEQMARDLQGNEDFMRIALIAVPPYGRGPVSENSPCKLGKLDKTEEWFVTTPAIALLKDGKIALAWEEKAPGIDDILGHLATIDSQ